MANYLKGVPLRRFILTFGECDGGAVTREPSSSLGDPHASRPMGPWDSMGITSSAAAEAETRSVGYAENPALPLGAYAEFRCQPADDSSVLIAFTRTGDANLDGVAHPALSRRERSSGGGD